MAGIVACSDFNAMKKIDKVLNIRSSYTMVKCPYCKKLHKDKFAREVEESGD